MPSISLDYVTRIDGQAFQDCNKLTSISLPSVTSIGFFATFAFCNELTSISLPKVTSIPTNAFQNCYKLATITLTDTVTSIGDASFYGCINLTSINLPQVTSIGTHSFINCHALTSVSLPKVTSIPITAFQSCFSLATITLTDTVTSIGNDSFNSCVKLTSINLPRVTDIGNNAFINCYALTSVNSPVVTRLANSSFNTCYALKTIDLPLVTSIGTSAFLNCYVLASVTIPSVTNISNNAFQSCVSIKSISLPNTLTSIGDTAFWICQGLTSITLPSSITSIRYGVFSSCTSLTSITLPSSITDISDNAFANSTSLRSISLPGVTNIGNNAFLNCPSMSVYTLQTNTYITSNLSNKFPANSILRFFTTITNFSILPKTFGTSFTIIDPSSNSNADFSYNSLDTSIATISGKTVTLVGVGETTIRASQVENNNYSAGYMDASLVVNKAILILSNFTIPSTITEHTIIQLTPPQSNIPYGAFTYTSSDTNVATIINNNQLKIIGNGTTNIIATQLGTNNYFASSITTQFNTSVIKFPQATDILPNQIIGTAEPNSTIVVRETTNANETITTEIQSDSQGMWNFNVSEPSDYFSFAPLDSTQFSQSITNSYSMRYPQSSYTFTINTPVLIKPRKYGTNERDQRSWKISPNLPEGLKFSSVTGIISGTPISAMEPTTFTIWSNSEIFSAYKKQVTIEIM
jgi:hypothetical protein